VSGSADRQTTPEDFSFRPLRLAEDLTTVHAWVSQEYARYWGLVGKSTQEVAEAYAAILAKAQVFIGLYRGVPAVLLESYDPKHDPIAEHYTVADGDRGMHVLLAPPTVRVAGFGWAAFKAVMSFLFTDPAVDRIIVEPDIRNAKIHALNRRAGFHYQKPVALPHKLAHLAFCSRADHASALARDAREEPEPLAATDFRLLAHLTPSHWAAANAMLVRKAIAELAHERVVEPHQVAREGVWGSYVLPTDVPNVAYTFRARRMALEHWHIELESLSRVAEGGVGPVDAVTFVLELRERLGIRPLMLQVYLEEILSTLYSTSYKRSTERATAADLVHAPFQELETSMTEGHPAFIANSGRIGFDATDFARYAPEAGASVQLVWLAARRERAELSLAHDVEPEQLWREELGDATLERFRRQLRETGLQPDDYVFLPVHPWQWYEKIASVFAGDLARQDLVCLGVGADEYRSQQSIRTFFNTSRPERRYVKTALSILNMGFMRGLSADYMRNTPAINDYLASLIDADPFFARAGFRLLREVATVGYRQPVFEEALAKGSPYRKMLAALFRESPVPALGPGRRLMTMAALLHRDRAGVALLPQLILASGLGAEDWLRRYLDCYLAPLLHCLFAYDLAFMPHGENLILLLQDQVPVGAFMKDIAEEAVIMDPSRRLPERVRRIAASVPDELKTLSIFTDVFDGILRFVADILVTQAGLDESRFWRVVAACVADYQRSQPLLREKFAKYELFAGTFKHSCLNRLQLRDNRQLVDLTDPAGSLLFAGTLANPIAPFRQATAARET
jgi:siderophore synthetase component/RimJ/RimL family protein N-acetyltransferase